MRRLFEGGAYSSKYGIQPFHPTRLIKIHVAVTKPSDVTTRVKSFSMNKWTFRCTEIPHVNQPLDVITRYNEPSDNWITHFYLTFNSQSGDHTWITPYFFPSCFVVYCRNSCVTLNITTANDMSIKEGGGGGIEWPVFPITTLSFMRKTIEES